MPNDAEVSLSCKSCGNPVDGVIEGIKLRFLCSDCCYSAAGRNDFSRERYNSVAETVVLESSELVSRDMKRLNFSEIRYGKKARQRKGKPGERFYLKGEIRLLENLKRKSELERRMGKKFSQLSRFLRRVVLGESPPVMEFSRAKCEKLLARWNAVPRASELHRQCPSRHPEAVLEFCLQHPHGTASDFDALCQKLERVLELEGYRILHYVPKHQLHLLAETPLSSLYQSFADRDEDAALRVHLGRRHKKAAVEEMMGLFYEVRTELEQYFTEEREAERQALWVFGPEDRVLEGLAVFYEAWTQRRETLETALEERGLWLPKGCAAVDDYLKGWSADSFELLLSIVDLCWQLERDYEFDPVLDKSDIEGGILALIYSLKVLKLEEEVAIQRAIDEAWDYTAPEYELWYGDWAEEGAPFEYWAMPEELQEDAPDEQGSGEEEEAANEPNADPAAAEADPQDDGGGLAPQVEDDGVEAAEPQPNSDEGNALVDQSQPAQPAQVTDDSDSGEPYIPDWMELHNDPVSKQDATTLDGLGSGEEPYIPDWMELHDDPVSKQDATTLNSLGSGELLYIPDWMELHDSPIDAHLNSLRASVSEEFFIPKWMALHDTPDNGHADLKKDWSGTELCIPEWMALHDDSCGRSADESSGLGADIPSSVGRSSEDVLFRG